MLGSVTNYDVFVTFVVLYWFKAFFLLIEKPALENPISSSAILNNLDPSKPILQITLICYAPFSGLGRLVRTVFLLEYLGSEELRGIIQGAVNYPALTASGIAWAFSSPDMV